MLAQAEASMDQVRYSRSLDERQLPSAAKP